MSVESEILRIQHNIADSYAKVAEKGGEVPLQPTSANLPAAVESIPQTLPPPDNNPIGTVISFMGTSAPNDYLVCDGAEYSISQYPDLAQFFQQQFGQKNHFGGDGVATFAVPDMRNLFLRGYHGEAGERLSGEVGERQDGTVFPDSGATETSNAAGAIYVGNSNPSLGSYPEHADTFNGLGTTKTSAIVATAYGLPDGHEVAQSYTARPVNMAVLYCIKAIQPSPALEEYDTDDGWHVRKWSSGYVSLELVFTISPQDNGSLITGLQRGIFSIPELPLPLLTQYSNQISIISHVGANIVWVANDTNREMFSIVGNGLPSTVTFSYIVTGRWK